MGCNSQELNQPSYAPVQCCAIKSLLQVCNGMIKQAWVMQSAYQSVERRYN